MHTGGAAEAQFALQDFMPFETVIGRNGHNTHKWPLGLENQMRSAVLAISEPSVRNAEHDHAIPSLIFFS